MMPTSTAPNAACTHRRDPRQHQTDEHLDRPEHGGRDYDEQHREGDRFLHSGAAAQEEVGVLLEDVEGRLSDRDAAERKELEERAGFTAPGSEARPRSADPSATAGLDSSSTDSTVLPPTGGDRVPVNGGDPSAAPSVARGSPTRRRRTMTDAIPAPRDLSRRGQWCLVLGSSLIVLFAAAFVTGFVGLVFRVQPGWWVLVPAIGVADVLRRRSAWRRASARPGRSDGRDHARRLLAGHRGDGRAVAVRLRHVGGRSPLPERDHPGRGRRLEPGAGRPAVPEGHAVPAGRGAEGPGDRRCDRVPHHRRTSTPLASSAPRCCSPRHSIAIAGLEAAGAGTWLAMVGGLALALNPVALAQLGTAMVDGVVSSVLLASLMLALLWVWRHPPIVVLPPLAAALVLLVNTKFTGLVYVGLIVLPVIFVAGLVARSGRRLVCDARWRHSLRARRDDRPRLQPVRHQLLALRPPAPSDLRAALARHRRAVPHRRAERREPARTAGALGRSGSRRPATGIPRSRSRSCSTPPSGRRSARPASASAVSARGSAAVSIIALAALLAALDRAARAQAQARGRTHLASGVRRCSARPGICLLATIVQPSAFLARFAPQLWFVPGFIAAAVLLFAGYAGRAGDRLGRARRPARRCRRASASRLWCGTCATPTGRRRAWPGCARSSPLEAQLLVVATFRGAPAA